MSDVPKPKVAESSSYDNLIDNIKKKNTEVKQESSLLDFMDISEEEKEKLESIQDKEWKKHWHNMPEFEQENDKPYRTIYVHFRNEEDYQEFSKLINQKITSKTKSIWHPKLDREANALRRWIEEE